MKNKLKSIFFPLSSSTESPLSSHMAIGTISIFLANVLILPAGFISAIFLAHRFGPVGYGLFALLSRFVVWTRLNMIALYSESVIKQIAESPNQEEVESFTQRVYATLGLIIMAIVWVAAPVLADLFNEPSLVPLIRIFVFEYPLFALYLANDNILAARKKFTVIARNRSVTVGSRLVLIIGFVSAGLGLKGAVLGYIGGTLSGFILSMIVVKPIFLKKTSISVRTFFTVASSMFFSRLCHRLFRMDLFALKWFGGTAAQAGFYGAALNMALLPDLLAGALANTLTSTLTTYLTEDNREGARLLILNTMRIGFYMIPLTALLAGSAPDLIQAVYGEQFSSTVGIFYFVSFASISMLFIWMATGILTSTNKQKVLLYFSLPMVPLAFIGHYFLVPHWNGLGSGFVTLSISTATAVMLSSYILKQWDLILPAVKSLTKSIATSIIIFFIASLWSTTGFWVLLKLGLLSLLILIILWLLKELTEKEIEFIRTFTGKKKKR